MAEDADAKTVHPIELATEITIAWLNNSNNHASAEEVPSFLEKMHQTITGLTSGADAADAKRDYVPAVPVRSSVKPDHIVSLIDGSKLKTLKRHLGKHGLTPAQYRERFGLKADYPMVAPDFAEQRRKIAQRVSLARKAAQPAPAGSDAGPGPTAQPASDRGATESPAPPPEEKSQARSERASPARALPDGETEARASATGGADKADPPTPAAGHQAAAGASAPDNMSKPRGTKAPAERPSRKPAKAAAGAKATALSVAVEQASRPRKPSSSTDESASQLPSIISPATPRPSSSSSRRAPKSRPGIEATPGSRGAHGPGRQKADPRTAKPVAAAGEKPASAKPGRAKPKSDSMAAAKPASVPEVPAPAKTSGKLPPRRGARTEPKKRR